MSHYAVLGIAENATVEEIRAAYRRAAQIYHPDRDHGNPAAEQRFKAAAAAYRVLRQPALRRAFDQEIGLGNACQPWSGAEPRDGKEAVARAEPGCGCEPAATGSTPVADYERLALRLATSSRWNAPQIAAHLARAGCPYRLAWLLAWRVRYQVLHSALDHMVDAELRDPMRGQPVTPHAPRPIVPPAKAADKSGCTHLGPSQLVRLSGSRSLVSHPGRSNLRTTASVAPMAYRSGGWSTRVRRLRQILLGISRLLGFEPPRLAREYRKVLRIEYQNHQRQLHQSQPHQSHQSQPHQSHLSQPNQLTRRQRAGELAG